MSRLGPHQGRQSLKVRVVQLIVDLLGSYYCLLLVTFIPYLYVMRSSTGHTEHGLGCQKERSNFLSRVSMLFHMFHLCALSGSCSACVVTCSCMVTNNLSWCFNRSNGDFSLSREEPSVCVNENGICVTWNDRMCFRSKVCSGAA